MSGPFNRRRAARSGQIQPMSAADLQKSIEELEQRIADKQGSFESSGYLDDPAADAEMAQRNLALHEEATRAAKAQYEREQQGLDEGDPERVNRRQAFERGDRWEIVERPVPDGQKNDLPNGSSYWLRSIDQTGGAQLEGWFNTREEADQELERRRSKTQKREPERKRQLDWFLRLGGQKLQNSEESEE